MKENEHGFFRHGDNAYLANFSEAEREVLTNLVEQIIELLAERVDHDSDDPLAAMVGITMHDTPPDDEVLLRLLPNAYADQVDASEFRRYTESTLRQKKQAHAMATEVMKDKTHAHEILVKEELGINAEELQGSATEAAIYSFLLFTIGAIIPVMPFFFTTGFTAIAFSVAGSAVGLFIIGAAITLFTGKNVWYSGFRQVFFGLAAAAITYGIGHVVGVAIG